MNCKVCNTPIRKGARNCPNCGGDAPAGTGFERSNEPGPLPAPDLSTARDEVSKLVAPPPRGKKKPKRTRKVAPPKASGETPLFAPDAASLRTLLAEQPEALESKRSACERIARTAQLGPLGGPPRGDGSDLPRT